MFISNRRYNVPNTRTYDTTVDAIRDRYQKFFQDAFMPNIRHEQMPGADERVAYAAEFAAHQLGQINGMLGRLIEIMEGLAGGAGGRSTLHRSGTVPLGAQHQPALAPSPQLWQSSPSRE